MGVGGLLLRICGLAIRVLQFLDGAVILGIFSYYLATLSKNDQTIATYLKAVEGLSGAATLYGLLGVLFVCCLGGVSFFAFLGVVLDVCFTGAMIAIAVLTRRGTQSCSGTITTPVGTGEAGSKSPTALTYGMACKLEKVVFAVSVIGIFLFLISILFQTLLARHHKREKRFGPSPANGYTSGSRRGFFGRKKKNLDGPAPDALPGHPTPNDVENGAIGTNEKSFFGSFGRNKNTNSYGNSAYTGNY